MDPIKSELPELEALQPSGIRPGPSRQRLAQRAFALVVGFACAACTAATERDSGPEPELPAPSADNLKGCQGKASSSIPPSGVYVLTTFGGPSESQSLACGGHSKSGSWYYAASRQRYGCGARVRIMANGKCVVAQTDDYGPDVCVEKAVGMPVMDASPLVGKALFGVSSLGWSDKKKVTVELAPDGTPLGPCSSKSDAPGAGGSGGSGSGGVGGASGGGSGGTSGSPSSGGSSGSSAGPGCTPSLCDTTTASTDVSGQECYCDSECAGYGDCCSNIGSVCGSSGGSGGSSSGGGGSSGGSNGGAGGGQACSNDGACNPGNDGSGLICVGGVCVPGCKSNAHCPGNTTCQSGQCV